MSQQQNTMMTITDQEFKLLRNLVYDRFGINMTEQKRSLLVGRLQKMLKEDNIPTFKEYYDILLSDTTGKHLDKLINKVSTNFSYFYREEAHFNFYKQTALPELISKLTQQQSKDIRIWTAGCSTGEEPYMLIMLMMEHLGMNYNKFAGGILATDISNRALTVAKKAEYPADRVNKVPAHLKTKYFLNLPDNQIGVKESVTKEIILRRFNLMNKSFPFKKPFQMIFCRNVMIYFDQQTRLELVRKFHQSMEPGGYFFIGHSETLGREQQLFKYIMPACYQKM